MLQQVSSKRQSDLKQYKDKEMFRNYRDKCTSLTITEKTSKSVYNPIIQRGC